MVESYTLSEFGVTRASDRASIPESDDNRDWRAYQEWVTEGNVADPIPVVIPDPAIAQDAAEKATAATKITTAANLTTGESEAMFGAPTTSEVP